MPEYVVMFPADDETQMDARSDAERQVVFDTDHEFGQRLAARGGAVTGGSALVRSSSTRTLRRGAGGAAVVTDGPATASTEQLSGFFVVTCDSLDTLVEAAEVLVGAHPVVEIRPVREF